MKRIIFSVVLTLLLGFGVASCITGVPISKNPPENNPTYQVEFLFEHEGCKVYRFWDYGNYVYFTNCEGSTSKITNDSTTNRMMNITSRAKY